MSNESNHDKWDRSKTLLLESLYEPNTKLRGCAHNQGCFDELMVLRDEVIDYVKSLKNPHANVEKPLSKWR
tara:strand:+ start:526 stop:738 length:213 start_codon:yes stop_codon:yes gene_type:complete